MDIPILIDKVLLRLRQGESHVIEISPPRDTRIVLGAAGIVECKVRPVERILHTHGRTAEIIGLKSENVGIHTVLAYYQSSTAFHYG